MTNNIRRNRRAATLKTIPVRDNRIFDIFILQDGYPQPRLNDSFYYRRHIRGVIFTGSLAEAQLLPKTARY